MKKLFTMLFILLFACNAHAGLITYTTLSGDEGLSYTHLNTSFSTIYDEFDGNVSTENILDDTLAEADFADEINPRIRTDEGLGDFTYTGMLPATSASTLTSNISAGTSYVNGYRIVTAATSKTYTATKDTWVYIDQNGAFQYSEVAVGGAQPTTPTNSLLLATVTTDADNITTVTDRRATVPPNLRIYQDLKFGAVLSRDTSDVDVVNIYRGTIDFGSGVSDGLRRNTVSVDVNFGTTGRGGLDTGSLAKGYYAIWAVPDDANATAFECVGSTSFAETALAIDGERLIGWCYANSATAISPDSVGAYRGVGGDAPNIVRAQATNIVNTTSTSAIGIPLMYTKFWSSGRPVRITFAAPFYTTDNTYYTISISVDDVGVAWSHTDDAGGVVIPTAIQWEGALGSGQHTIEVKWETAAQTLRQGDARNADTYRSLIVEEL